MAEPQQVTVPSLVTLPDVDIVATGEWNLSTGAVIFTKDMLADGVAAADCPAVGWPVIKIGHTDERFTPTDGDGTPALGRVKNLRLSASGNKIVGDLAGMPGWLGSIAPSAFPQRSVEGVFDFRCQIGHVHPFVLTGLALLGTVGPGVGVLNDLQDIAALYGVSAAAPGQVPPEPSWSLDLKGGPVPKPGKVEAAAITVDDVTKAYYSQPGLSYSRWICEVQMSPLQLIVCDDAEDNTYRVPVTIKGQTVSFADPVQVEVEYTDVAARRAVAAAKWPDPRPPVAAGEGDKPAGGPYDPPDATPPDGVPEDGAKAAGATHPYSGTHTHEHTAGGSQGGDEMHSHSHSHDGDGSHDHSHASASAGEKEGATEVAYTDEQAATLRKSLGLAEDVELTEEVVAKAAEALAAKVPAAPAAPAADDAPVEDKLAAARGRLPAGVIAVDQGEWDNLKASAKKGESAHARMQRNERDGAIDQAIAAGKFSVARRSVYERLWDADPKGTADLLATMAKGAVPLADIGSSGGSIDDLEADAEFDNLFPPAVR